MKRRKILAHGAAVTLGTTLAFGTTVMSGTAGLAADSAQWLARPTQKPAPSNIGMTDVKQVEAVTSAMRTLDYQFGGGACRDAVVAQLSWAQRLLSASSTDGVRARLFRALADMQNLAGWTAFDVGLLDPSRQHFTIALQYARQCADPDLLSNIMYRIGRVFLHHGAPHEALSWFQLGQRPAQDSGSALAVAVLCSNEAWAYAVMGDDVQARKLLGRSQDELARADLSEAPDWARFYNETDMNAMIGTVHTVLSAIDLKHAAIAIPAINQSLAHYDESMSRSRAFMLTALATNHLRQGDVDHGVRVGRDALTLATGLQSKRVTDRLRPLELAAGKSNDSDSRQLAHLIRLHSSPSGRLANPAGDGSVQAARGPWPDRQDSVQSSDR
ncbi:MAG TPA: transcriptional regulator [Pseudonocardiaceae bacterium]|nr:transcriptional regulator [Pseudonocardiaceae bacterium]